MAEPKTAVESARESRDEAQRRYLSLLKQSCRALYDAGFRLNESADHDRVAAWREAEAEAEAIARIGPAPRTWMTPEARAEAARIAGDVRAAAGLVGADPESVEASDGGQGR